MASAAILKIRKILISPQRFDRSLQNLVWWCKVGLLTALTVKCSLSTVLTATDQKLPKSLKR